MNATVDFHWGALSGGLALLATLVLCLCLDMGHGRRWRVATGWAALIGVVVALLAVLRSTGSVALAFGARVDGVHEPILKFDGYTRSLGAICLLGTALCMLLSMGYLERYRAQRGEYYILMLLSALGMLLIAGGNDLMVIFIGVELLSLPLYILAGFRRTAESSEASLKYFLLGAFSSGFLLYGIALVYGATGTTNLTRMAASLPVGSGLFRAGILLVLVGFAFKVAAVPFHQWAPDVYQGAPTPVTAFFASAPKVAGFAGILRIFLLSSTSYHGEWQMVFAVLAALTMTVGNVMALTQTNVKRMLAYSSVAHAGYVLVGLSAGTTGVSSAIFYLLLYSLMSIGAFGALILHGDEKDERLSLNDFAGMGFRRPVLGAGIALLLLSLAGFPPTAGFLGKLFLFREAYEAGLTWLVVIGVLNSVVSAFYYLSVVVKMYMTSAPRERAVAKRLPALARGMVVAALVVALLGVVVGGIAPSRLMSLVNTNSPAVTALSNGQGS
jgi:NADH-quinone oxidoreductase subunit N